MGLVAPWHDPGPGLEPVSPALAGGFLTTVPPGKSSGELLLTRKFYWALFESGT